MAQSFIAELKDMEVRKIEETAITIEGNCYPALRIHFDTPDADRLVFTDKQIDRKDLYHREEIGLLKLRISTYPVVRTAKDGKLYTVEKTSIVIDDWKPKKA